MIMFDGVIVAAEWFDEKRYGEYRGNGMTPQQAQAWVNAVELTEIFQGISLEKAKEFAYFIARLWDEAIKQNFPDEVTRASVVLEADLGEVFVTIGEFSD
ncbi:hypothetical protein DID96_28325 [Burkholderia sp. Bp8963]|nr:hypothetical protein DID96_28325 [Burkholderia sp. Bp8963]